VTSKNPYRAAGTFSGPAYIERSADRELRRAVEQNQRYPYMLAPRQSGKSSLLYSLRSNLDPNVFRCGFVDLSTFRPKELRNYDHFLCRLFADFADTLRAPKIAVSGQPRKDLLVLMAAVPSPRVVLLLDEIDALRRSRFKNTFFSDVRNIFNDRADPNQKELKRIQFVLAGAARVEELITDSTRSPFNVGEPIRLDDFTLEEVMNLCCHLDASGPTGFTAGLPERLHYHAGGSVYLTQLLLERLWDWLKGQELEKFAAEVIIERVDTLADQIVSEAAQNIHFRNITLLLKRDVKALGPWRQVIAGQTLNESELDRLRAIGLAGQDPTAVFRNRIYKRVFDQRWVHQVPYEPKPFRKSNTSRTARLHGVVPLPGYYVPRKVDLVALKQKVLIGDAPVGITGRSAAVGVQGMGGIGKTMLAAALAYDPEVREAFPDGIYWVTIGLRPNLLGLQGNLLYQLTGFQSTFATEQEGKDMLRDALEGRRALVVLDDVWSGEHADAFSVTVPPARLLITTRNNQVLVGLGAEEHRVDVLSPSDALMMLAEWVGQKSPDKLPLEAAEVAKECGYLPLALAMIGAMIRLRPTAWEDALDLLRASDLEEIQRAFPGYPYPNLLRAIEVSVEVLDAPDRERYLDLAVFTEDQPIPETALSVQWKLDARRTRGCMTRLVARSLATWATDGSSLILHDLQRDLIHKRRETDMPGLHLRLVEAWDALSKLPDAYAWRWVGYHMVKAGRKDDLRRLLLDFNYLQAKLVATDANALIADYDYFTDAKELHLIQSALQLSTNALAHHKRQLAGQLTGRLIGNRTPIIQALLKQADERTSWPWLRPLNRSLIAAGGPLIRTLEGHTQWIRAVAVTPDGRYAVSGSDDNTLRFWNLGTGQTIRTLKGHTGKVMAVSVTSDGRFAVSGSLDRTLRLWKLESGETIHTLEGHTHSVRVVAVTPEDCAVSGSWDGTLILWHLKNGKKLRTLEGHTDWINSVAVTLDGRRAFSASNDQTLRAWDLESGRLLRTLKGHTGWVNCVAVMPDGGHIISGSEDQTLRLWDLETGETIRTFGGHTEPVKCVAVMRDGVHAISGSEDQTLRLWDLETGETIRTFRGHTKPVKCVAVTPDGRAVSGSDDQTLRLWDLESGQTISRPEGHTGQVNAVTVTPNGRYAVSASSDRMLRLWDLETGQTLHSFKGHTKPVNAVAVTPDGRRAVSGSTDGTLRLWDLSSGRALRTIRAYASALNAPAVTPDGSQALSGSDGGTLRLWDMESGETIRNFKAHMHWVTAVAVASDGRRAISASKDQTLRLWDLETGQTLRTLEGHTDSVTAVAVTPDCRQAVSGSDDGTLRLWDLENGKPIRTFKGHTNGVTAVAVTPDWRQAVSGSDDGTLRLWDLQSGETIRTFKGHIHLVSAVAVTPDGRRAVSASKDKMLRLWDLESGEEIATFIGEDQIGSCAVAPNGRTIIGGDNSGRVYFLRVVEPDETIPPIGDTKIQLLMCQGKARSATD
jgi:WD40 repeat protein